MGILKSYSLEETFVTFINIYVQVCDFSVLNSVIAIHPDRTMSLPSSHTHPPTPFLSDRSQLHCWLLGGLLGLAGGVKIGQRGLEALRPEDVSISL